WCGHAPLRRWRRRRRSLRRARSLERRARKPRRARGLPTAAPSARRSRRARGRSRRIAPMNKRVSRLPGFYKDPIATRRQRVGEATGIDGDELARVLDHGGLDTATADKIVENVVGIHALPFGLGLNFRINERDYLVPMVVEEPSVIAAASNAAKMVRTGGGFVAEADAPIMTSQVAVHDVTDPITKADRILGARDELLREANASVPGLVERGGGARDLEVRVVGHEMLVVHILVDCRDAMGANLVN